MRVGDQVRTCVWAAEVPIGSTGRVKAIDSSDVSVEFPDGRVERYRRHDVEPLITIEAGPQMTVFGKIRLPQGSHLCLLPSSYGELVEVVGRYVAAGLEAGEACLCFCPFSAVQATL